jgi:hypothetical protein
MKGLLTKKQAWRRQFISERHVSENSDELNINQVYCLETVNGFN